MSCDVLLRITQANQKLTNTFPMITLKHDLTILRSAATGTKTLQLLSNLGQIRVLIVQTINNRSRLTKLPSLKPNTNPLLFLANLTTSTYVLGKPACRTNLSHDTRNKHDTMRVYKIFKQHPSNKPIKTVSKPLITNSQNTST